MTALADLDFSYHQFLDKSTILFGASGSGKSIVMVDILYHLRRQVDQIIVISPTDRQNHTYDSGIVPLPCIHYNITPKLLEDIWERQNAMVSVYTKANKPEVLRMLFNRIVKRARAAAETINSLNSKLRKSLRELSGGDETKAEKMEKECQKLIVLIFKQSINEHYNHLNRLDLTEEERFSMKYLNMNPRLVLIFDDCTDLLKKYKSHHVMQKLFYQGRWANITTLIACHTDKALDPELKKNAFITIFTEETSAHSYFGRPSNDLTKEDKGRADAATRTAFGDTSGAGKHQKLAWVRNDRTFYKFTSSLHNGFQFGSPYLWEYCSRIQAEAGALSTGNRFISEFV